MRVAFPHPETRGRRFAVAVAFLLGLLAGLGFALLGALLGGRDLVGPAV